MIKVVLRQARPGMVLARALLDPHHGETALLNRGDALTPEVIGLLHETGIYELWIQDAGVEGLDDPEPGRMSGARSRMCEVIKQGFHAAAGRTSFCAPFICALTARCKPGCILPSSR